MKQLLSLCVSELLEEYAQGSAGPTAGSAAALTAAVAAALTSMVARLTVEKAETGSDRLRARYGPYRERARELGTTADQLRGVLLQLVQEDADLVEALLAARRQEAHEAGDAAARAIAEALDRQGGELPLGIARTAFEVAACAEELFERGYQTAAEDARTAIFLALAAARSALALVRANLEHVKSDAEWTEPLCEECRVLAIRIHDLEARTGGRTIPEP